MSTRQKNNDKKVSMPVIGDTAPSFEADTTQGKNQVS